MAFTLEPEMHQEHHVPTLSQPPSPPPWPPYWSGNLSADIGAMEGGPQRTSAVPLSILELQSVDEKSKSAVTKLGLLPSTVLTVQSRGKKGRRWGTTWVQTLGVLTV